MPGATSNDTTIRLATWLVGLGILLLTLSACGDIIQIVPVTPPTPAAVSQISTPSSAPAAETTASAPTRVVAPSIGLEAPVAAMGWRVVERDGEQVSEWELPNDEAGWHRNSARPGEGSNIVISGHNGSTGGQVFVNLDELQAGDELIVWTDSQEPFEYQVTEKTIVRTFAISDEADQYLRTVTEPTAQEQLTLITCWPNWTNTHRLIVIAEPK